MQRYPLALCLFVVSSYAFAKETKSSRHLEAFTQPWSYAETKAPHDQEVCFAPDEPCALKLLKFIESAKKTIDVAIYDINLDLLVQTLLAQAKKEVTVRIVVDKRQSKGSHSLVNTLIKDGANIRFGTQRGVFHDKFVIVDAEMIETGSFNFTAHASLANQENQLYIAAQGVVQRYVERFEKIWSSARVARGGD